jgi:hypothetical protein
MFESSAQFHRDERGKFRGKCMNQLVPEQGLWRIFNNQELKELHKTPDPIADTLLKWEG